MTEQIDVKRDGEGRIWSPIRQKWLVETPEELVRQKFLLILTNEYGYKLDQMKEEESVTGRGSGQARADFIIWRTAKDKFEDKSPLIVIECKSDNVSISPKDYHQGDHYARMANAPFFVTHNTRETRFWRVQKDLMPGYLEEIENIPTADSSDLEIDELVKKLKTFKEDEFADLLHQCHNVIRNRDHLDPAAAFDEIAKILFVKVWVERELREKRRRKNLFNLEFLDNEIGDDPLNDLFEKTKRAFRSDNIFALEDRINLKPATSREIVRQLERYNLSDTSEDVKGIAFERFLGRTFRGEIGQFFTPRTIVEFMVRMVAPNEKDVVCDPASGSGGFLIRFFEIVREEILADVDRKYQAYIEEIQNDNLTEEQRADLLLRKYEELQETLDSRKVDSRLWKLANRYIYGCDANDRMARTSKMNMIMHGDGHGGVHHHNGFINVNGIFEERFDIILTNPPFGANVEPTDCITDGDVNTNYDIDRFYTEIYGQAYREAQARTKAAAENKSPIASLFELPYRGNGTKHSRNKNLGKIKTEILFIERCLALLKPGGRMGIVLPEGVFNNPTLSYVREFCEDRAYIQAVISLPQETFYSAGATVKASLLFMKKYSEKEAREYEQIRKIAIEEVEAKYRDAISAKASGLKAKIEEAKKIKDTEYLKKAQRDLRQYLKQMDILKDNESRKLLKERFKYPIFLYDAEHVGITATGERDSNELYYDEKLGLPSGFHSEETALSQYQLFCDNPESFILASSRSRIGA